MRFSVDISQSCTTLYLNSSGRRIYPNGSPSGEINHQSIVTERTPANVVSPAPNRREQIVCASEVDSGNHIRKARAAGDHHGMLAYAGIPDLAGFVVTEIRLFENLTVKCRPEGADI